VSVKGFSLISQSVFCGDSNFKRKFGRDDGRITMMPPRDSWNSKSSLFGLIWVGSKRPASQTCTAFSANNVFFNFFFLPKSTVPNLNRDVGQLANRLIKRRFVAEYRLLERRFVVLLFFFSFFFFLNLKGQIVS
jgi:hypothetical protein